MALFVSILAYLLDEVACLIALYFLFQWVPACRAAAEDFCKFIFSTELLPNERGHESAASESAVADDYDAVRPAVRTEYQPAERPGGVSSPSGYPIRPYRPFVSSPRGPLFVSKRLRGDRA